ncbi:MAG: phenylacetic acid degradation protein PaaY [Desulfomonilaceae bacterium]
MQLYEFERKRPWVDPQAFVHPQAVLIGDVMIEAGCYVGAGAVLRGDIGSVRVGAGSNVQENCVVHTFPDKATTIHPNAHVGHGCILHGCEICSNVLVGMGSIVGDDVKINSHCIIGAGSFVEFGTEIPPESVAVGSPARVVKAAGPEHLKRIADGLAIYQELTRRYLKSFKPAPCD